MSAAIAELSARVDALNESVVLLVAALRDGWEATGDGGLRHSTPNGYARVDLATDPQGRQHPEAIGYRVGWGRLERAPSLELAELLDWCERWLADPTPRS